MKYKTLLIDAMNVAYKQYLKLPDLQTSSGMASSTIYGFLNAINSLYRQFTPEYLYVCWEGRNSARKRLDPTYKLRPKDENEKFLAFMEQVIKLQEILPQIGVPSYSVEGLESDDLMAALAHEKELQPALIVSGDNDMLQCLEEGVNVLGQVKKVDCIIDEKMFRQLRGYGPELWVIYKATAGCNSDTVKGIKGWGKDKAVPEMLAKCNYEVDKILAYIAEKGKTAEFLHALRLVTLPFDYKYNLGIPIVKLNIDRKRLAAFFFEYDITNLHAASFLKS